MTAQCRTETGDCTDDDASRQTLPYAAIDFHVYIWHCRGSGADPLVAFAISDGNAGTAATSEHGGWLDCFGRAERACASHVSEGTTKGAGGDALASGLGIRIDIHCINRLLCKEGADFFLELGIGCRGRARTAALAGLAGFEGGDRVGRGDGPICTNGKMGDIGRSGDFGVIKDWYGLVCCAE